MKNVITLLCLVLILLSTVSCRGWRSEKPPIHMNPNLDFQAKNKPQDQSLLFPDNTIPWGNESSFSDSAEREQYIKNDTVFYLGKDRYDRWVKKIPIQVNHELLNRGQDRYEIYCTPCHGLDGSGKGAVTQRGWMMPAAYWDDRILNYADGYLFEIISNGIRSMPGYKQQLTESDRWAIVSYVRALQKTHTATYNDVPEEMRNQITE